MSPAPFASFPLTGRQRQLRSAVPAVRCWDVAGPLDLSAFHQAIRFVVARHEPLRTCFPSRDGAVVQVVHTNSTTPVTVIDSDDEVDALVRQATEMCPDSAPPVQVLVARRSTEDHLIVFALHPLIADRRSMDVLLTDVAACYSDLRSGIDPAPTELDIQYLDWAEWRQSQLSTAAELYQWWQQVLANVGAGLPVRRGPCGPVRRVRLRLDARAVADLCRRENTTAPVVFAAACATMLARRGARGDLAMLMPVDNRDHVQVRDLVGPFEEFLPVVFAIDDDPTFRELLGRVRSAVTAMHAHRDLPIEQLAALSDRDGHVPVPFSYRRAAPNPPSLAGCLVKEHPITHGPAEFTLTLVVEETDGSYEIGADHDETFTRAEMDELVTEWLAALHTGASRPGTRLSGLDAVVSEDASPLAVTEPRNRYGLPTELLALQHQFARFLRETTSAETPQQVRRLAGAAGFLAPRFSVADGGRGTGVLGTVLLIEQAAATGRVLARSAVGPPGPTVPSPALVQMSPILRERYLPGLVRGTTTMCVAISERTGGSDLSALATRAVRTDDGWLLGGEKVYISHADDADVALTIARTADTGAIHADLTAFLVPRRHYSIADSHDMTGDMTTYTVRFDEARVSADHVVSTVGNGLGVALAVLDENRIYLAAQALGLAQWCFDQALSYVRGRQAYGRPLGDLQGVSFGLVDCDLAVESMRVLTYETARRADRDGAVSTRDCSLLKLMATEQAFTVADRCVQLMGARGLDRHAGIEAVQRYLRMLRVVEGSSELQRSVLGQLLELGTANGEAAAEPGRSSRSR